MEPSDENLKFWSTIENGLNIHIPVHIKNTLKYKNIFPFHLKYIQCLLFIYSCY